MTDRHHPVTRTFHVSLTALALCLGAAGTAHADVFGRLHVVVTDGDTAKPVPAARVTLHDPTGVHGDIPVTPDARSAAVSPPLEIHAWQVSTAAAGYDSDTRAVTVSADTTTKVGVGLSKTEKVKVDVHADGSFDVSLVTSSGNGEVDGRVLGALKRWKWKPALQNGQPVASTQRFRFDFQVQ